MNTNKILHITSDSDSENESENLMEPDKTEESYTCRACDQIVSDRDLNRHHVKCHPEISLDENIYDFLEPIENQCKRRNCRCSRNSGQIEEEAQNEVPPFVCGACSQYLFDCELDYHHVSRHRDIPLDVNIYSLLDMDINNNFGPIENQHLAKDQQFQCLACDRIVSDRDLNRHHRKHHLEIPLNVNIYELLDINGNVM